MTPQAISFSIVLIVATLLHLFVPQLSRPAFGAVLGGLGLAAALLSRNAKDAAWIQALEDAVLQQTGGSDALSKLRLQRKPRRTIGLFVLALSALFGLLLSILAACASLPAIVQSGGQCLGDILAATQGVEDPLRIETDCGATLAEIIAAAEAALAPPDAGIAADGGTSVGLSTADLEHRARVSRILTQAKALQAQGMR